MKIEILTSKEFKKINEKSEDQSYSAGCIMGYFDKAFLDIDVKEEDLYNNEENEYGREIEDHVTVLYGLTDDEIDESEIVKLFTMIDGPLVSTEQISLFQNDKFDVVKFDIISDELTLLNKVLTSTFPFKSTFPDYHAHSTIAYCLPGTGDSYVQTLSEPVEQKISYWVYSKANGKKIKITPGIGEEILREARVDESITESAMLGCDDQGRTVCFGPTKTLVNRYSDALDASTMCIDPMTRSTENDFDEEYNGHTIKFMKNERLDAYFVSVFLGDEYKICIKGPVPLEQGREAAINYIDGQL